MFLRLLVPIALLFPLMSIVVDGTSLRHYAGTWSRELAALLIGIVIYFAAWFALDALLRAITGSSAAGLVGASLLALLSLYPGLLIGFKLTGVRRSGSAEAGAH